MNAETVNAATKAGRAKAEAEQLGDLTKIYLRLITAAGRRAAAAFRQSVALVAATDPTWVPPANNLINAEQLTADGKRKTAGPHEQILRTVTAADVIGIDWTLAHPTSQMLLASVASRLDTLNAALRLQVSESILFGYNQGWSVARTAAAIIDKVAQVAPARAAMYARTDLIALSNGGSLMAAQIAGVAAKSWLTAGDDLVREAHADAEGQTVPINQPFDVDGEQLDYPGDPAGSLENTANCRCTITYSDTLSAALSEPLSPEGARMEPMTETLTALRELVPGLETLTDAEVMGMHALILAATKMHGYRGNGGACAICGEAATADCHYQAAADETVNAAVTIIVSDDDSEAGEAPVSMNWEGVLTLEGLATSDGRYFMPGAWGNRDLPLTLLAQLATEEGHDGAQVCGTIENIWKVDRPDLGEGVVAVMGAGTFDPSDFGRDVARLVAAQTLRGVSVDYTIEEQGLYDPATSSLVIPDDSSEFFMGNLEIAAVKATIGAATLCALPAFAAASISVTASISGNEEFTKAVLACGYEFGLVPALVASVAPLSPPASWFDDPKLDRPTPLQITDDGRVYGHLALWSSCHQGFPGRCVPPPRSSTGYSLFHVGAIKTEEGETLAIGKITLKAPHADVALNSEAARAHYDNTGTVAAFVRAGEDQFGPWVAGALRSDAPEEIVRDLLANPLSGDWRAGEMIAAHAVPAPGFPVLRAAAFDEAGEETETALIMTSPIPLEGVEEPPLSPLAYLRPGRTRAA